MDQIEIQLTLQICTLIIGLYLALFKSYFHEKGKNIATKQDIEEITNKIEVIKSDIGVLTHKKISLGDEKQKSLLDFNGKYFAWLNFIVYSSIGKELDPIITIKKQSTLESLFHDLSISEAKIHVFFHSDEELLNLKDKLILETMHLSKIYYINLIKIDSVIKKINIIRELPNETPDNSFKMEKLNQYHEEQITIVKDYQAEKILLFKPITALIYKFSKLVSNRMYEN